MKKILFLFSFLLNSEAVRIGNPDDDIANRFATKINSLTKRIRSAELHAQNDFLDVYKDILKKNFENVNDILNNSNIKLSSAANDNIYKLLDLTLEQGKKLSLSDLKSQIDVKINELFPNEKGLSANEQKSFRLKRQVDYMLRDEQERTIYDDYLTKLSDNLPHIGNPDMVKALQKLNQDVLNLTSDVANIEDPQVLDALKKKIDKIDKSLAKLTDKEDDSFFKELLDSIRKFFQIIKDQIKKLFAPKISNIEQIKAQFDEKWATLTPELQTKIENSIENINEDQVSDETLMKFKLELAENPDKFGNDITVDNVEFRFEDGEYKPFEEIPLE